MNKQKYLIIFIVLFLGLGFSVYQYSETFKTEVASATSTVPNPGHLWSSMECNSDSLCVDTTNNRLGIGTTTPGAKLESYNSAASIQELIRLNNPDVIGAGMRIGFSQGVTQFGKIDVLYDGGWQMRIGAGNMVSDALTIKSGNVGIGTTGPAGLLN